MALLLLLLVNIAGSQKNPTIQEKCAAENDLEHVAKVGYLCSNANLVPEAATYVWIALIYDNSAGAFTCLVCSSVHFIRSHIILFTFKKVPSTYIRPYVNLELITIPFNNHPNIFFLLVEKCPR